MKTQTSIKLDSKTKKAATRLAEDLDLTLSSVVNASLKQFIRNRELHVVDGFTPTPFLENLLKEAEEDLRADRVNGPYSVKEFVARLKKL